MARFVFALEALLEQRRREERAQMKVVAQIERERVLVEGKARTLAGSIMEERQLLRDELAQEGMSKMSVDLSRVRRQANASLHHVRRTQELVLDGAAILGRLEKARAELLKATTRRRAVELLRERRLEAWHAEQRRKEMLEYDELLTARFGPGRDTRTG